MSLKSNNIFETVTPSRRRTPGSIPWSPTIPRKSLFLHGKLWPLPQVVMLMFGRPRSSPVRHGLMNGFPTCSSRAAAVSILIATLATPHPAADTYCLTTIPGSNAFQVASDCQSPQSQRDDRGKVQTSAGHSEASGSGHAGGRDHSSRPEHEGSHHQ